MLESSGDLITESRFWVVVVIDLRQIRLIFTNLGEGLSKKLAFFCQNISSFKQEILIFGFFGCCIIIILFKYYYT